MERVSAQAELDATKNKKPDTTEVDALRKELQTLKTEHQASLMTAQQTAKKATEEHLATRSSLEKAQADLEKAQADLEEEKAVRKSDFDDMHGSLTQVCEEATRKATDAEARLEEATKKASDAEALLQEATKKAADADARLKEAEAVIKVKEAELAETKVLLSDAYDYIDN